MKKKILTISRPFYIRKMVTKNNKLEVLEAASQTILNDVVNGKNDNLTKYYSQLTATCQQDDRPKEGQRYFNNRPTSMKMCS